MSTAEPYVSIGRIAIMVSFLMLVGVRPFSGDVRRLMIPKKALALLSLFTKWEVELKLEARK